MDVLSCLWAFVVLLSGLGSLTATTNCSFPKDIFGVQIESWDNIRSSIAKFYLDPPSNTMVIDSLNVPPKSDLANIGRRLRTYFLAPQTGSYIFYLACDDVCELNLSADEKLENLVTLINIKSYTAYMAWNSLNSKEVRLSKGHSYLLEAILDQGVGEYHITVGVKLPDGNDIRPVNNEFLVKYKPPGAFGEAPIGEWGSWSQCSRSCGVGTQSRNRSYCPNAPPVYWQRNTTDLEMRVCQPIRPCSVPLSNIQVRNTSSTSLLVKWKSEWQDRWPQELLPFKIAYNKTENETAQVITANGSHESVEIRGLAMYTRYCIRVQLVTLGGVGQESPCVFAMTDEDVPCNSPTKMVARNHSSPNKIRLIWQPLAKSCWRGIPKGYSVRLKVKESAHVENQTWSRNFSVGPLSTGVLIEGLQTYTTYSLQVASLTNKGPGPYSEAIYVDTCRCPKRFFVNWMQAPPLCFKNNHINATSPAGILPELLPDMITHACGTCHGHKRTTIIFKEEMFSIDNITSSLDAHTQLNLPMNMAPHIPFAREEWVFLPVVEVAGTVVLMKKPHPGVYAGQLGSSVLRGWPVFLIMFVMYCVFGLAVWSVVRNRSGVQFETN